METTITLHFVSPDICSKCGGECCKEFPGTNSPEDFNLPEEKEKLINALESGRYTIDVYESEKAYYYVRPSMVGKTGQILDFSSYSGQCNFLTSSGCELNPDERPEVCRGLEPKEDFICKTHHKHGDVAKKWLPYRELLVSLINPLSR